MDHVVDAVSDAHAKVGPIRGPSALKSDFYDAIVVGTGMGAGAAGYVLAMAGMRVLFLERGLARKDWNQDFSRDYSERFIADDKSSREGVYKTSGRATYRVNSWIPVMGGGEGGSTAVYGAVFLPFHPNDFSGWPFDYAALRPYYERCDRLFAPRGTSDPLSAEKRFLQPPGKTSAAFSELTEFLQGKGLHPFRTPMAYKAEPACAECFGHFCQRSCKYTSANVFIEPATRSGFAEVRYSVSAKSLLMEGTNCIGVLCETPQGRQEFRAKSVFLAAGALVTPTLLANTKTARFPKGVGNQCDLVGRFLMRHLIDFHWVKTPSSHLANGHLTEVSFSDFNHCGGFRWGIVNAVGNLMDSKLIAADFAEKIRARVPFPIPTGVLRFLVSTFLHWKSKDRILLCSIMEDSPDHDNRVLPTSMPDDIRVRYRIPAGDRLRLAECRRYLKRLFKPLSGRLLKVAEDSSFLAHACGTCRMHADPRQGVTDPEGKVHGTENLYVVDASIFPSSGGSNPSMTIAACALKIAEQFVRNAQPRQASQAEMLLS